MKIRYFCFIALILLSSCRNNSPTGNYTLIKGGTLIDLNQLGQSTQDIDSPYVLISGDKIEEIGRLGDKVKFPKNTKIIDAKGKYIIPGLIDGFAVINNQSYANAFLYMGITSVIGVEGGRRGSFDHKADPSPDVYMLESVGDDQKSTYEHLADVQNLYDKGFNIILLKYALKPDQVEAVKIKALELGMGCIGELGHTSYKQGIEQGIEVFVHSTRYSLDAVPDNLSIEVAKEPFSDDPESPKWQYYKYLSSMNIDNPRLNDHADLIGRSNSFIMPTFSLLYLDQPFHVNPWGYSAAGILDESDINNPADRITGNHTYDTIIQENYSSLAKQVLKIEKKYKENGAKYLAGSATDVWGTMPGISLHTELEQLSRIGLSNREVIASATSNFQKAFDWKTGKIEKGFAANILILNANPIHNLEALTNIHTILLKGKEINREKLLQEFK